LPFNADFHNSPCHSFYFDSTLDPNIDEQINVIDVNVDGNGSIPPGKQLLQAYLRRLNVFISKKIVD
jgi:hypothetical protein